MILLTGATGFLGQYLIDSLLAAGHEVRVLVRGANERKLPAWAKLVEVVDGDILDPLVLHKSLEGIDAVVHAAAMVSFAKRDTEKLLKINVEGTANLVDACLEVGQPRFVHVSSIASIGRTSGNDLADEDTPWLPQQAQSAYAKSKRKAEREVYRGMAEGLDVVMVNPGVILGAGDWTKGTPQLFASVHKGLRYCPNGRNGWVGAKDVAEACRHLLEGPIYNGARYILVGENADYLSVFGKMARALGVEGPRATLPRWVLVTVGKLAELAGKLSGKAPQITAAAMRSATGQQGYDGQKITQTGFAYTALDTVIQEIAERFLTDQAEQS